jgi:hypothetical protein
VWADGKVTLVCSGAYDNFGWGLQVLDAAGTGDAVSLTLNGFLAYENDAGDEDFGTLTAIRTTCP